MKTTNERTIRPLTQQEKKIVEENHNIVFTYLIKHGYNIDEYYDIAVMGLINAAKLWCEEPKFREAYKFSTVACHQIRSKFSYESRMKNMQKRLNPDNMVYIDAIFESDKNDGRSVSETIGFSDNDFDDVETKDLYRSIVAKLNDRERFVLRMLLSDVTQADISRMLNLSTSRIGQIKENIMKKSAKIVGGYYLKYA